MDEDKDPGCQQGSHVITCLRAHAGELFLTGLSPSSPSGMLCDLGRPLNSKASRVLCATRAPLTDRIAGTGKRYLESMPVGHALVTRQVDTGKEQSICASR